jgi:hypothetical protein
MPRHMKIIDELPIHFRGGHTPAEAVKIMNLPVEDLPIVEKIAEWLHKDSPNNLPYMTFEEFMGTDRPKRVSRHPRKEWVN